MANIPDISEAEWKIMKVLWRKAPLPAYDIIQELSAAQDWSPSTVKALLARLVKKQAVGTEKYKNLFLYSPLVTEEECIHVESESFLHRIFGGSVQPLLVHFAKREKLTKKDLEDLRKILEGKGR